MEKQCNRTEKNKSLRTGFEPGSRYTHDLKPLSYMRTVLVLFCLARYSYFIIQSSNEWIFRHRIIRYHYRIGCSNLYVCISLNQIFLLCQCRFLLRKKSTPKSLTIIRFLFFMLIICLIEKTNNNTKKYNILVH